MIGAVPVGETEEAKCSKAIRRLRLSAIGGHKLV